MASGTPKGKLKKKIQRQLISTRPPPTSGPSTVPSAAVSWKQPCARPTWLKGANASVRMAMLFVKRKAPPRPMKMRAATRSRPLFAGSQRPPPSDPMRKTQ